MFFYTDLLDVYDTALTDREKDTEYKPYKIEISNEHPFETFLESLRIGSLIDILDVESKWYTGYITNIDTSTRNVKVHFDDWPVRFDELHNPLNGKIASYRTHAIGGRIQGCIPGTPLLPIKPKNNSVLTEFQKMILNLKLKKKS